MGLFAKITPRQKANNRQYSFILQKPINFGSMALLAIIEAGVKLAPPILFLDGLINDMMLVLKIFVILTIISYVVQHLGKGPLAIIIIALMSWFILFDQFMIFGGIYLLYMMAIFGGVGILMDFFIVGPQIMASGQMQQMGESEGETMTGREMQERQRHMMQMRRRAGFG